MRTLASYGCATKPQTFRFKSLAPKLPTYADKLEHVAGYVTEEDFITPGPEDVALFFHESTKELSVAILTQKQNWYDSRCLTYVINTTLLTINKQFYAKPGKALGEKVALQQLNIYEQAKVRELFTAHF